MENKGDKNAITHTAKESGKRKKNNLCKKRGGEKGSERLSKVTVKCKKHFHPTFSRTGKERKHIRIDRGEGKSKSRIPKESVAKNEEIK